MTHFDHLKTHTPSDYKILMVDDIPKNLQLLGSILKAEKYKLEFANNGKMALNWMEKSDFDLILLDINMPVLDGIETCKIIRSNASYNNLPIIFLTAETNKDCIVSCFQAGGQDYVTKPFDSSELLARISTQLQLRQSKLLLSKANYWLENEVTKKTKQLKQANEKLLILDQAKSEFLNIISHEIRTPLNGIINGLEILTDQELSEDSQIMFEILNDSVKRLEDFSYKAIDISSFNTKGAESLYLDYFEINELIQNVVVKYQSMADEKGIALKMHASDPKIPLTIDISYITKCISYIIDNAIKFANYDTNVLISVTKTDESLKIRIDDEGANFPPGFNIQNIKPFATSTHIDNNPALSLYLCKQIVEAHSGEIRTSNIRNRAVVDVVLPISVLNS